MVAHTYRASGSVFLAAVVASASFTVVVAQDGPVAAMFRDDLKREHALSASFLPIELPAGAASSLRVYLSAGDLARAFDRATSSADAAIVPTNAGLVVTAASPATQRVLIERVEKVPRVMADLQDQIATRRKQTAGSSADGSALEISVDAFVAQLPGNASAFAAGAFPKMVCLIATDFANGGAVDRRDLFSQDRVRKGVAACLSALDAAGATSVMMPLLGAASAQRQSKDPVFEGQRLLQGMPPLERSGRHCPRYSRLRTRPSHVARDRHRPVGHRDQPDVQQQPPRPGCVSNLRANKSSRP